MECEREKQRKYRKDNPEKERERKRKWKAANRERVRENDRQWVEANPEKLREKDRKWREANPEKKRENDRQYRKANPEKKREQSRKWSAANPEKVREGDRRWRAANRDKRNAFGAARKSRKLNATPPWADLAAIKSIYAECARIVADTGVAHHVDHIVPLQGRTVCGLHVETNLQILTASENIKKGNRLPHERRCCPA